MEEKKIAIASDHAGFERKRQVKAHLEGLGYVVKDFGCFSTERADYPDFGHPLAEAVENGTFPVGITFCGSGNGISMTTNKHQGIRAALCWKPEIASLAKQHNNANVCALPARFVSHDEALAIVDAFLEAEFDGGRHKKRIDKIPLKH